MAEGKSLNLGNLNPICERELTKLDVHQVKGRKNVCRDGEGGKGCPRLIVAVFIESRRGRRKEP